MEILIDSSETTGRIIAPSSKSQTHRAMICALLSEGRSVLERPLVSDDTMATLRACEQFGAEVSARKEVVEITGDERPSPPDMPLDCGESASTLRMMMTLAALCDGRSVFTGKESLLMRPVAELIRAMGQLGISSRYLGKEGFPPVEVEGGGIIGGIVSIRGDISSQYISSILFASPRSRHGVNMSVNGRFESMPYVQMTVDTMERFGVKVESRADMRAINVRGGQKYAPTSLTVEGDYSSAAFAMASGCINGEVTVQNLDPGTKQGDKAIIGLLQAMGAEMSIVGDSVTTCRSDLKAIELDCAQIPDLVPILAVLCTQAGGISTLKNLGRLRIKESDRVDSISRELAKMGANIRVHGDSMEIKGKTPLNGTVLDPHNDHRIAMSLVVAAISAKGESAMKGTKCISKSYPSFLDDMKMLGAAIDVV
ncbi:MAG TPA: 3-phosphoshikimate 1-carboxyvinyltransferase [Candidatus Methanofastidiosa archaeon]|nr:3-phosphoshikimate 1-carboxyvinyltransferase [Candidatus Methanofastidiosa archaeon]